MLLKVFFNLGETNVDVSKFKVEGWIRFRLDLFISLDDPLDFNVEKVVE